MKSNAYVHLLVLELEKLFYGQLAEAPGPEEVRNDGGLVCVVAGGLPVLPPTPRGPRTKNILYLRTGFGSLSRKSFLFLFYPTLLQGDPCNFFDLLLNSLLLKLGKNHSLTSLKRTYHLHFLKLTRPPKAGKESVTEIRLLGD